MELTRRQMVWGSVAIAAFSCLPRAHTLANDDVAYRLDIRTGQAELLEAGGAQTPVWAYDGIVPGPLLRAKRGHKMTIAVTNNLQQPTTVHWHGLRIANAMDGVAGLTQPPIGPGETFNYDFTPADAGTHWYHSHQRGWEQVARGLYGPIIVDETEPVDVDRDLVVMADDWQLKDDGLINEETFGNLSERAHGGRLGNVLTLNGKPYENLAVKPDERVRLRMINCANARIMHFRLAGLDPWIVALDGQPITPLRLGEHAVRLAPAQRADLVFDITAKPGAELAISEVSGDEPLVAGYLHVKEGDAAKQRSVDSPLILPVNDLPVPDLTTARVVELNMTGGAMRFLKTAVFKGKTLDGGTLAREHGHAWAFNGIAGTALEPMFSAAQGETIVVRMKNDTAWPHAMHVHGHHFIEVSRKPKQLIDYSVSGAVLADAPAWRDTVLMQPNEVVEIAFVADNPGSWLLHCHMMEHMAAGMVTWFEVRT